MPTAHNFILSNGAVAHNCSHSVAYGEIAYTTAYLKCHYPLQWWASVLSSSEPNEILEKFWPEISHLIELPDVNVSKTRFTVHNDKLIPPLKLIANVGPKAVEDIASKAPFQDLTDFVTRIDGRVTNKRCVIHLIQAGALDCLFAPGTRQKDKIQAYLQLKAAKEGKKKIDESWAEFEKMTPLEEYLLSKKAFPAKIALISDAVKNSEIKLPLVDMNHYITGQERVLPSIRGNEPLVTGKLFKEISENIALHNSNNLDVCAYGYVMSARRFNYFSKKQNAEKEAVEILIDIDNFLLKTVCWPRSGEFSPKISAHIKEENIFLFKIRISKDENWKYGILGLDELTTKNLKR